MSKEGRGLLKRVYNEGYDQGWSGTGGIRPVLVLPPELLVEEVETGKYDLVY